MPSFNLRKNEEKRSVESYDLQHIEYLLDVLLFGEAEEQVKVITEKGRKVMEIERRIKEYDSDGTAEAVGSYGCDGTETDGKRNSGDAGIYAERGGEKQSA